MARRRHSADTYSEDAETQKPHVELPPVGSMVSFYSAPGSTHADSNEQPLAAIVAGKGSVEGTVNLLVIESNGCAANAGNVPVLNDGDEAPETAFVMPAGGKPAEPAPAEAEPEAETV